MKPEFQRLAAVLAMVAVSVLLVSPARADDQKLCTTQSFAPLDGEVPACSRMLDSGTLTGEALARVLFSRARAYLWARTYRGKHKLETSVLLEKSLDDLNKAIATLGKSNFQPYPLYRSVLKRRASTLLVSNKPKLALRDYGELERLMHDDVISVLYGRARARRALGLFALAIEDIDIVVRISKSGPNHHSWVFERGAIFEAAGDRAAARQDYETTRKLVPGHIGAKKALERLGKN